MILHHKTDGIKAGEDIVYIVITSGHRKKLFPALNEVIERIKAEAPIWIESKPESKEKIEPIKKRNSEALDARNGRKNETSRA